MLKLHMRDILSGLIGLVCGILIAILVSIPLQNVEIANGYLPLIITTILAVLGWSIGVKKEKRSSPCFKNKTQLFLETGTEYAPRFLIRA